MDSPVYCWLRGNLLDVRLPEEQDCTAENFRSGCADSHPLAPSCRSRMRNDHLRAAIFGPLCGTGIRILGQSPRFKLVGYRDFSDRVCRVGIPTMDGLGAVDP